MNIFARRLAAEGFAVGIVSTSDKNEALDPGLGGISVAKPNHKYSPRTHLITD